MTDRSAPRLTVRPITIKRARRLNADWHRRLKRCTGGMWALRVESQGSIVGILIAGRPVARLSDDGDDVEVLRCAVLEGHPNACSALYGAASRAGRAMGVVDMFTFVHADESGHSLKAAGWVKVDESAGGEWDRKSRPRQLAIDPLGKVKWAPAWSAMAKAQEVASR